MKVAVPVLEKVIDGKKMINPHFGKSKLFAVVDTETGELKTLENPATEQEKGKGRLIAETFYREGVEALLIKDIGEGAFEKISSVGIKVFRVPENAKFLEEALELFKEGKLTAL